ncbi:MAG: bifunctional demethylmenaquinone methyltransferase/2-methoxy-6-polyprenyl-1,4-benzoquinol methylase UbiE [Thermoanaerobaculia bacterium]
MPNKFFSEDDQRAPKVREMFSLLAGRYDLINDLMSAGLHRKWKRDTVRLALEGRTGRLRVLDLCCGTGDLAFLAEADAPLADVTGADFTLPMLRIAQSRCRDKNGRSRFAQADALRLPFRSGTYDAITIGYGLRNVADIPRALSEIRRVLAPGGRLVVLDFGKPAQPVAGWLYQAFLRTVMPAMGWLFHRDPETYLYIPESLAKFPAQKGVEELMKKTGFVNVRYENRLLGTMGLNVGEAPASS